MAETTYCWIDDCHEPAVASKPHGMAGDTPVEILVCYQHAGAATST